MSLHLASHRPARAARGLSIIESLLSTAVVAAAATTAGPAFTQWRAQQSVVQAASVFETDVQLARSQALSRNEVLRLTFETTADAAARCYVLYSGPRGACQCAPQTGDAICQGDAQAWRTVVLPANRPVRLESNAASLSFDPVSGTVSPAATVRFSAPQSTSVHQVVGILGRVRSCTSGGRLSGYKAC